MPASIDISYNGPGATEWAKFINDDNMNIYSISHTHTNTQQVRTLSYFPPKLSMTYEPGALGRLVRDPMES